MPIQWKDNKKLHTPPPPSRKSGPLGISVIEILIVIAIITTTLVSLLGIASFSLRISTQIRENTQAVNLAQEAVEAVWSIKDNEWLKLTPGYHGLINTGGYWDFWGTENIINEFTRRILIEEVYRDNTPGDSEATDDIETDGIIEALDYLDPDTKKVTVTVTWKDKNTQIVTYLTNWRE